MNNYDSRTKIALIILGITGIGTTFIGEQQLNTPNCIKLAASIFILGLGIFQLFQKRENTDTENLPADTIKEKTNKFTSTPVVVPAAPFEFKNVIKVIRVIAIIIFVIGFAISKIVSKINQQKDDTSVIENMVNSSDTAVTIPPDSTAVEVDSINTNTAVIGFQFPLQLVARAEGKDSMGVIATITKNEEEPYTTKRLRKKDSTQLDFNANYILKFSKPGFVSKSVYFNTHIPVGREADEFAPFTMQIVLVKKTAEVIIDTTETVGGVKYMANEGDFDQAE